MATLVASSPVHASRHVAGGADALPWTTIHGQGLSAARPTAGPTNVGYLYFQTDGVPGLYRSDGATWTLVASVAVGATNAASGLVQLAGDLAGTAASPTVAKVNGTSVPASTAAATYLKTTAAGTASWAAIGGVDNGDGTVTITF